MAEGEEEGGAVKRDARPAAGDQHSRDGMGMEREVIVAMVVTADCLCQPSWCGEGARRQLGQHGAQQARCDEGQRRRAAEAGRPSRGCILALSKGEGRQGERLARKIDESRQAARSPQLQKAQGWARTGGMASRAVHASVGTGRVRHDLGAAGREIGTSCVCED